jgi:hypothetical protein
MDLRQLRRDLDEARVLDLEPIPRRAPPVGRAQPFRHDAFEAKLAGLPGYQGAVLVGMLAQDDAKAPLAYQPRQPLLAVAQRQSRRLLPSARASRTRTVSLADGALPVQGGEDCDPVRAANDRDSRGPRWHAAALR